MSASATQDVLRAARRIATYARDVGVDTQYTRDHKSSEHLGAVLADSVLQAGLNYRTVVKGRVERIVANYPEAATLAGAVEIVRNGYVGDFLMWHHSEKIGRFSSLVRVLECRDIESTDHLRASLQRSEMRAALLTLRGIGPKTIDYMSCLIGLDCIAVDRHIRVFVLEAGITARSYDEVKLVVSYAADFLGMARRNFDSWIWHQVSSRSQVNQQMSLF